MEKRKALCHEYPTTKDKIEKYGYDPKQLHHIVRLEHMIAEMMDGYSYGESLVRTYDRDMLLDIKTKPTMTANEAIIMADKMISLVDGYISDYRDRNGREEVDMSTKNNLERIIFNLILCKINREDN